MVFPQRNSHVRLSELIQGSGEPSARNFTQTGPTRWVNKRKPLFRSPFLWELLNRYVYSNAYPFFIITPRYDNNLYSMDHQSIAALVTCESFTCT